LPNFYFIFIYFSFGTEYAQLKENRPNSQVVLGPVCPSYQHNVTMVLSSTPGWSGSEQHYEPSRQRQTQQNNNNKDNNSMKQTFQCHHLATELKQRQMYRIDYMTIDTEGSEPDIVQDFPWNEFDVRVVQIEQLVANRYPSQAGKKEAVIRHLQQHGYQLLSVYPVAAGDTDDLMFVRDLMMNITTTTILPTQPSRQWIQQYSTQQFLAKLKTNRPGRGISGGSVVSIRGNGSGNLRRQQARMVHSSLSTTTTTTTGSGATTTRTRARIVPNGILS
jgi:Methyltransferase FkbM domain